MPGERIRRPVQPQVRRGSDPLDLRGYIHPRQRELWRMDSGDGLYRWMVWDRDAMDAKWFVHEDAARREFLGETKA